VQEERIRMQKELVVEFLHIINFNQGEKKILN